MKGHILILPGQERFPRLHTLLGAYFHQDCSMHDETLEDIISEFRKETTPEIWKETREDIERFLSERMGDDKQLNEDVQQMFLPDVMPDAWEPDITTWRQWLTRVSELLKVGVPASMER